MNNLPTVTALLPELRWISVALSAVLSVACATQPVSSNHPTRLLQQSDFAYRGSFLLPSDSFGESSVNWSPGVIEVNGDSLFIVGNDQDDAIAEFQLPAIRVAPTDWIVAQPPEQGFNKVFNRLSRNTENLDQITGMELQGDSLVLNTIEYYDAPADNRLTTLIINNPDNLSSSTVAGPYAMRGSARASGWISRVPPEWQSSLGCTHISGASSGGPIIARHSVGPSAFCVNLSEVVASPKKKRIDARELLGFSLRYPLRDDLFNESGDNKLWTHISNATYGFIVPGTSTYATFGNSGGHASGLGYKLKRPDGSACPGYCANDPSDSTRFFWLWDVRDLWRVARGGKAASQIEPYAWGEWPLPFGVPDTARLGGASYDESTGVLYVTLLNVFSNREPGKNPPIVLSYTITP